MTMEATIERPPEASFANARSVDKTRPRVALEIRVEQLTAELLRQGELMYSACLVSDELRGLAILFHGVFCDTTLTEDADFRLQRVSAAYLVENLLKRLAERLETAEDHARTSRLHALKEGA